MCFNILKEDYEMLKGIDTFTKDVKSNGANVEEDNIDDEVKYNFSH